MHAPTAPHTCTPHGSVYQCDCGQSWKQQDGFYRAVPRFVIALDLAKVKMAAPTTNPTAQAAWPVIAVGGALPAQVVTPLMPATLKTATICKYSYYRATSKQGTKSYLLLLARDESSQYGHTIGFWGKGDICPVTGPIVIPRAAIIGYPANGCQYNISPARKRHTVLQSYASNNKMRAQHGYTLIAEG